MASQTEDYVCIACPIGCPLQLVHEGTTIREISGNNCKRGAKYAKQEFTDPRRSFSTTIPIEGAIYPRLPVKLSAPIRKEDVLAAARAIHGLSSSAPVACGQVLLADLLGQQGINVVACRTMARRHRQAGDEAPDSAPATAGRDREERPDRSEGR